MKGWLYKWIYECMNKWCRTEEHRKFLPCNALYVTYSGILLEDKTEQEECLLSLEFVKGEEFLLFPWAAYNLLKNKSYLSVEVSTLK